MFNIKEIYLEFSVSFGTQQVSICIVMDNRPEQRIYKGCDDIELSEQLIKADKENGDVEADKENRDVKADKENGDVEKAEKEQVVEVVTEHTVKPLIYNISDVPPIYITLICALQVGTNFFFYSECRLEFALG